MSTAICLGGGEIGRRGTQDLLDDGARVLVVDPDEGCRARPLCQRTVDSPESVLDCGPGQALFIKGDGIDVLEDMLERWTPDLVVPALPGHLAAHLAMAWSLRTYRPIGPFGAPLPKVVEALPADTVQLVDTVQGVLVASHMPADAACQEGCSQPSICPVTFKELTPMDVLVDRALTGAVDRRSVLVTSGSKVGAIRGTDIRKMLDALSRVGEDMTVGIATSCRCHAIVNIFRYGGQ